MKKTVGKRLLSILLCLVMVASYLPASIFSAVAEGAQTPSALQLIKVADPSTKDDWKTYFGTADSFNTEFAGAVWTDKSVFTDASAFSNITTDSQGNPVSITMQDPNDLLVALSAMASNMTVSGQASVPTDTMLVLDVSGSMNDDSGNNDVAEELAQAANTTIHALLTANPNNRVGVVLYSGASASSTNDDAAVILLPLGRYTTGMDNEYVNYTSTGWWDTTETISLDRDVRIAGTTTSPSSTSKNVVGATYIQKGVILAMDQLIDPDNTTNINGVPRKPILVLMSDGAPTLATTSFTAPGQYNLGNGRSTSAAQGFVTQLSCAYAKAQVEEKYATDALFYTIGLGTTGDEVATSVLDPANSNSGINEFWRQYNRASVGSTVRVQSGNSARSVTKISTALEQNYVNKYIAVREDTDLAQGLKDAFTQIVSDIQLQSKYYPTLTGTSDDLSGYVSFVDKIGSYMSVSDVKGILLHDQLFSGLHLAQNFVPGGGILGTEAEPTATGTAMMEAVRDRLGLSSDDAAVSLINNAYYYGQLAYDPQAGTHSNYIGWYADANSAYMGFYHEGVTQLPADAVYTVKSYGFLGDTVEAQGVSESDMMYATVQVRHNIATGEEEMLLKIPASLLPTVTYEVELDESGNLKALDRSGASYPFRLLYEVGLDSHITSLNLKDYVSADYLAANTNADGSVNFYSNQYEVDNSTGYGKVNTYSYFNPSHQNDRYYFQQDSLLYTDESGTLYTGDSPSSYNGTLYWQHTHYEKTSNGLRIGVHYQPISPEVAATALRSEGASTWYIPKDTVRTYTSGFVYYKGYSSTYDPAQNPTDTLHYAKIPFVDTHGYSPDDPNHSFVIGSTLGNNGRLTVMPATGIKLTKTMAEGVADPGTAFTFTVKNLTNTADSSTYAAVLETADGTATDTSVTFSGGTATVQLKAGESLYITGLAAQAQFEITEAENDDYVSDKASALVEVAPHQITDVSFVNSLRGKGNLMINKHLFHAQEGHTVPAAVLQQVFQIQVDLGTQFAGKTVQVSDGTTTGSRQVDSNGTLLLQLQHGQTVAILDLPEGTRATVAELTDGLPSYITYDHINSRDHSGAELENDGTVTIGSNTNSTVMVYNEYLPTSTSVDLSVQVNKNFQIESPLANASFTFKLQEYVNGDWSDVDSGTISYNGDSGTKSITLPNALDSITFHEAGWYAYQVIEVIPQGNDRLPGVSYDRTTHTFSVQVTDNGGQLVATVIDDGVSVGSNYQVSFTNTYHTAPVSIDVVKEITNTANNPETTKTGFLFQAFEATANWELLDNTADYSVRSDAVGKARFSAIYNQVGTRYFVIKEANEQKPGWTYDTTEYRVKVEITEEADGNLVSAMTIEKVTDAGTEAVTGSTITFSNTYKPAQAILNFDTAVRKELIGRTLKEGEFTFAIFPNGKASHTSLREAMVVGTNKADGSVDFETGWPFDQIGTYQYDILELLPNEEGKANGITYDTRIYDLVVEVTDDGNGKLSASYYYEDSTTQTVTFTNTYKATDATYTVTGNKQLTGKTLINDEFIFTMTQVADANGTALAGAQSWTTTNAMDGSITFPAITYTQPGTYYYQVSEKQETTSGGITFDDTVYIVTVTVTDNGRGALTATGSVNSEAGISFVNHYVPAKTSGSVSGDKVLEGKVLGAGAYQFQLHISNAAWEDLGVLGQPVPNGADGKFQFPAIEYTVAGTYYHLVSEVNGGETIDGVKYDDTVFRVKVTVTDDLKGQLHAETVVFDQYDIPQAGVQFVNTYTVDGDASLVLTGEKTLTGRAMADGEFTFELYQTDSTYTVSGNPIATATNKAGQFVIKLDYTAANDLGKTYYYVLQEKNAGQTISGVTYDNDHYLFTVTVTDDGAGGLKLTVTTAASQATDGKLTTVTGLNFQNVYYPRSTTVQLQGTKTLEGNRSLRTNDFTFQLYAADSKFVVSGDPVLTTKNDGSGRFVFGEYALNSAGSHYFVVKEANGGQTINGITYDPAVYHVTVTVEDDNYGLLKVTDITYQKVTTEGTTAADGIAFQNTYDPADATVSFSGKKVLEGKDLAADMFSFVLHTTDSQFIDNGSADPITVGNAANGSFSFGTKTFTEPGTYYFQIKEVNGGSTIDGITYDPARYNITVKVEDKDGKLIPTVTVNNSLATVTVSENTAAVANIRFTNTYKANPTKIGFSGTKTLEGIRALAEKDFSFQVYRANDQFVIQGTALQTAQNDADGKFAFHDLPLNTAGKHYFVVKESSADPIGGVIYDTTEYHITVTVTDNGEGQLKVTDTATVKVAAEGSTQVNEMTFVNDYEAKSVTTAISGTKTLTGAALLNGEFTFKLQPADEQYRALSDSQPIQTVNNGDGIFSFEGLTFTEPGTYYYTVTEVNTEAERMTYDETVYQVSITVTDDENGQLVAADPVITVAGQAAQAIAFENTYTPRPDDLNLQLDVQKTVKNTGTQSIGPEGFTFVLEESADAKLEAVTDANGKASFRLTVTEDMIGGTYTLKLYEKNDGKANVTYSSAVYEYVIRVSLSGDNKLVADITCNGQKVDGTGSAAQFENVYDYTPPATPQTGDSMNLYLWFSLLGISALAMAAAIIFRKKILG